MRSTSFKHAVIALGEISFAYEKPIMARLFKSETAIEPEVRNTLYADDPSPSKRQFVFGEQVNIYERTFG